MAAGLIGTTTSRETYTDYGESIDIYQVLGFGQQILQAQSFGGFMYGNNMAQDNIVAHSGGGAGAAVPIIAPQARITVVAAGGDSVILPVSKRGMQIALVNDATSNAANVFPAPGEQINGAGANVAFSLAAQNGAGTGPTIFYCYSAGFWRTK